MAPKKAPAAKQAPTGRPTECNGLYVEGGLPLWPDANELAKEDWTGGKGAADFASAVVDEAHLFVDPATDGEPPAVRALEQHNKGWKRPGTIFSPFKPVVVKVALPDDPYEGALPPDAGGSPGARADAVARYRTVRKLKNSNPVPSNETSRRQRTGTSTRAEARRNHPTPCYMQAFNSCLVAVQHAQSRIPKGSYLWELIYPQEPTAAGFKVPVYNPYGKYAVRMFARGAWRKLTIDDRLPTDIFGQPLLTVTEVKEIWPALLAKAVMKLLGPQQADRLFTDPLVSLCSLMPGFVPQSFDTRAGTVRLLNGMNTAAVELEKLRDLADEVSTPSTPSHADQPAPATPQHAGKPPVKPQEPDKPIPAAPTGGAAARSGALGDDDLVFVAVPEESPSDALREEFASNGLHLKQLYYIAEVRPYENIPTTMVRVVSPFIAWSGEGSYDDLDTWNDDFEYELGFSRSDRLENDNKWTDAWLPWKAVAHFFPRIVGLRQTVFDTTKYEASKSITLLPPAGSSLVPPPADDPAGGDEDSSVKCRWIFLKAPDEARLLFAHSGEPCEDPPPPAPPGGGKKGSVVAEKRASQQPQRTHSIPTIAVAADAPDAASGVPPSAPALVSATIEQYDWMGAQTVLPVKRFTCKKHDCDSFTLAVPPHHPPLFLRLTVEHLVRGSIFSMMSNAEVPWYTTKEEALAAHSTVTTWAETGDVAAQLPGEVNFWFKKPVSVKQRANVVFKLEGIPYHSVVPPAGGEPDGKKQAGSAGKKGKEPPPAAAAPALGAEEIDAIRKEHAARRVPLAAHAIMKLVNLDTGAALTDAMGTITARGLPPAKNGYLLAAFSRAPDAYPPASYRITATSDGPLERAAPVQFKDVVSHSGTYQINSQALLFRFVVTPQEPTQISLILNLASQKEVPFRFVVLRNDEDMWRVQGLSAAFQSAAGPAFSDVSAQAKPGGDGAAALQRSPPAKPPAVVENLTLSVGEKGSVLRYVVECHLDAAFADSVREASHRSLIEHFEAVRERHHAEHLARCTAVNSALEELAELEARDTGHEPTDQTPASPDGEQPPPADDPAEHRKDELRRVLKDALAAEAEQCQRDVPECLSGGPPEDWQVGFELKLLANSARVAVEPDTSLADARAEAKAAWGREEKDAAPPAAADKAAKKKDPPPGKGQPPQAGAASGD
eukprot:gene2963-4655_t